MRSGRSPAERCTGPKWSRMVILTILVKMTLFQTGFQHSRDQNGPKWSIWPEEVHFGPFRSTNLTLAIPDKKAVRYDFDRREVAHLRASNEKSPPQPQKFTRFQCTQDLIGHETNEVLTHPFLLKLWVDSIHHFVFFHHAFESLCQCCPPQRQLPRWLGVAPDCINKAWLLNDCCCEPLSWMEAIHPLARMKFRCVDPAHEPRILVASRKAFMLHPNRHKDEAIFSKHSVHYALHDVPSLWSLRLFWWSCFIVGEVDMFLETRIIIVRFDHLLCISPVGPKAYSLVIPDFLLSLCTSFIRGQILYTPTPEHILLGVEGVCVYIYIYI